MSLLQSAACETENRLIVAEKAIENLISRADEAAKRINSLQYPKVDVVQAMKPVIVGDSQIPEMCPLKRGARVRVNSNGRCGPAVSDGFVYAILDFDQVVVKHEDCRVHRSGTSTQLEVWHTSCLTPL